MSSGAALPREDARRWGVGLVLRCGLAALLGCYQSHGSAVDGDAPRTDAPDDGLPPDHGPDASGEDDAETPPVRAGLPARDPSLRSRGTFRGRGRRKSLRDNDRTFRIRENT